MNEKESFCADYTKYDQNMNNRKLSEVQQFYDGKNVLITGATGKPLYYI